ncbi:helix-turn-helix domain-containing protein [Streptomyces sp. NPDC059161]|uniref:helix-turn-helix domain-containing protein n=1 Tax=unclassified Streptomyces TaxID=2593676 RepID=UPI003653D2FE
MNIKELDPESSPQAAFGARLRRLREEHGWTQDELGEEMGCSSPDLPAGAFADFVAGVKAGALGAV